MSREELVRFRDLDRRQFLGQRPALDRFEMRERPGRHVAKHVQKCLRIERAPLADDRSSGRHRSPDSRHSCLAAPVECWQSVAEAMVRHRKSRGTLSAELMSMAPAANGASPIVESDGMDAPAFLLVALPARLEFRVGTRPVSIGELPDATTRRKRLSLFHGSTKRGLK